MRRFQAGFLAALGICLATASVRADMIDTSSMKIWEHCALCHNLDGISKMAKFPKLAGQPASYIVKQLGDFKEGARANDGGQMVEMASELDVAKAKEAAKYFSSLPPPAPVPLVTADPRVEKIFTDGVPAANVPACNLCHAGDQVAASGAPRLEAQHADYIAKQLHDFKEGRRENDPDSVMRQVVAGLPTDLIEPLAAYLASLERK